MIELRCTWKWTEEKEQIEDAKLVLMSKQNWNELHFFIIHQIKWNKMGNMSHYDTLIGFLDVSTPGRIFVIYLSVI